MSIRRWLVSSGLVAAFALASPAQAQQTDVIRGRITGPDSLPIQGITVTVTSYMGNVTKTARTDRNGRYTVIFPNGEGDYWISVTAIGYVARRVQLKRLADEEVLIGDLRLASAVQSLDAVNVVAQGARAIPPRTDNSRDVGGGDRVLTNEGLTAEQAGNLAAMAANLPGIQLIPGMDGQADLFSALGIDPSQNNTTLNGLGSDMNNLPPDALVNTLVNTSPYDVANGGFSGGQIRISTRPGSNFSQRGVSGNGVAEQTQFADSVAEQQGAKYNRFQFGGNAAGPITMDQMFYNFAYSLDRTWKDVPTLLNTTSAGLAAAGVSRDSVGRLLDVLDRLGVPATVANAPESRVQTGGSIFGNIDFIPAAAAGHALNLTLAASGSMADPTANTLLLTTPTRANERRNWGASAALRHTSYFGFGVLSVTTLGIQGSSSHDDPILQMPQGSVRLTSELDNDQTAVSTLSFGGGQSVRSSRSSTVEALNQLSWFSGNNKHRLRVSTSLRHERFANDVSNNLLGSFSFNSLADLEDGRPASFSRQLSARNQRGGQLISSIAIGNAWRVLPSNDVQIVYGVRFDGNRFLNEPSYNARVDEILGLRNNHVPNRVYVSPRVGFSWVYGTAQQIALTPGAARVPRSVIQGGVGLFQNTPNAGLITPAIDQTGLPGAATSIVCQGIAAPTPEWELYRFNPGAIPTECADGTAGTVFSSAAPSVTVFDKSYATPRRLGSNLMWTGAILGNRFRGSFNAEYALGLNQPGSIDANFRPDVRFTLANEGNRPVFVEPTSIDAARGSVAIADSRVSGEFRSVNLRRSDLRTESRQFTTSISPLSVNSLYRWGLSYTFLDFRDQYYGFTNTDGNPLERHWGRAGGLGRSSHVFGLNLFFNAFDAVRINANIRRLSGARFTPMVDRDINGDGSGGNDRAFVFDPATTSDPAIAAAMQTLLTSGSKRARECLSAQLGHIAGRGSCTGPWYTTMNLNLSFNPVKVWMPQRTSITLGINNPLGGLDLLLNGQDNLKGWGQPPRPDERLLFVRGFDPATQQFRYDVNSRFGSSRATQTLSTNPASINLTVRVDIGYTRERQVLTQNLDRGRRRPGDKLNDASLRSTGANTVPNPIPQVLAQADSLKLTRVQADSLATMNRRFTLLRDSIWVPVGRYLAGLPDDYSTGDAYDRYVEARQRSIDALIRIAPAIKSLLTPAQQRMLPPALAQLLDERFLRAVRSGTANAGGGLGPMIISR